LNFIRAVSCASASLNATLAGDAVAAEQPNDAMGQ